MPNLDQKSRTSVCLGTAGELITRGYRLPEALSDIRPDEYVVLPLEAAVRICAAALERWNAPAALIDAILSEPQAIEDVLRCELALNVLYRTNEAAHAWPGRPNAAEVFAGLSPLEHMARHGTGPTRDYLHEALGR